MNRGEHETRILRSRGMAAEDVGFPFAAQCARVLRIRPGREDEEVGLITDLAPGEWSGPEWLAANRLGWGIENGSHQRLDVTLNDDRCRVRSGNGQWVMGMFRRLVISLFMHWRGRQPKPHHKTLTDFQAAMGEDNLTKAMAFVTRPSPKLD